MPKPIAFSQLQLLEDLVDTFDDEEPPTPVRFEEDDFAEEDEYLPDYISVNALRVW